MRFRGRWLSIGGVAAIALLGGSPGSAQTRPGASAGSLRAARETMLAADRNVAAAVRREGLARALGAALGTEGLLLFEGAPIVAGAEAAARVFDAAPELVRLQVDWLPLAAHVSPDGSLGATYGVTLSLDPSAGDTAAWRASRYICVWRRRGETWVLAAHALTRLLPAPPAPPADVTTPAPAAWQRTDGPGAPFAAADRAFARLAGDSGAPAAFARFVAPTGAVFAATGEILVGPDAIGARMRENPNRTQWAWGPWFAGASDDGEMGFTVGEAAITTTRDGTSSTVYSKYLTVWRRLPDGAIRFLVDGGNARPARP
ncbi:MAG TPA: hypothetical protein VFH97_00940 [Gemmatimonadales bacterium]|nr:hypothetical protein [Gemmatimonadales bacterium]